MNWSFIIGLFKLFKLFKKHLLVKMRKNFLFFLISSITLFANSCGKEDPFFSLDNTAPVIAEVTAVTTPTNDNTPNYTFSSTESERQPEVRLEMNRIVSRKKRRCRTFISVDFSI